MAIPGRSINITSAVEGGPYTGDGQWRVNTGGALEGRRRGYTDADRYPAQIGLAAGQFRASSINSNN